MIARRIRDHSSRPVVNGDGINEIGCAANLESASALEIFTFEERLKSRALIESARNHYWSAMRNGTDSCLRQVNIFESDWRHFAFSMTIIVSTGSRCASGKRNKVPPATVFNSTVLPPGQSLAERTLGNVGKASSSSFQSST